MKKSRKSKLLLGFAVLFFLMGMFLYFGIAGFSFSALVCFGIAAVLVCFWVLKLLPFPLGRILRWCVSSLLSIGLLLAAFTGVQIAAAQNGTQDATGQYLVVLGAGVNGNTPSYILRTRIDAAYDYLKENPDVQCIVSGGQGDGENISEAQCMFDHLTAKGIDPERIWLEDQSTSTKENLAYTLEVIREKTGQAPASLTLLSNEFHLYRAGLFAAQQGITAQTVPADTRWTALYINYFLREIVCVWYLTVFGG